MTGIFETSAVFTTYHARLRFRDKVMGGIPRTPDVIEGWLRTKMGLEEQELHSMMLRTLYELGVDVAADATMDQLIEASKTLAGKAAVGFKRDEQGLYLEDRQVKAMIKENVSILFSGAEGWENPRAKRKKVKDPITKKVTETDEPLYRKSPKNFTAERVFVNPSRIHLGVDEPSGVELIIGHVVGPQGPRSTLTYHEYVTGAEIEFDVLVTDDSVPKENWPLIWVSGQENGLGAVRSQSYGRFDVLAWDKQ